MASRTAAIAVGPATPSQGRSRRPEARRHPGREPQGAANGVDGQGRRDATPDSGGRQDARSRPVPLLRATSRRGAVAPGGALRSRRAAGLRAGGVAPSVKHAARPRLRPRGRRPGTAARAAAGHRAGRWARRCPPSRRTSARPAPGSRRLRGASPPGPGDTWSGSAHGWHSAHTLLRSTKPFPHGQLGPGAVLGSNRGSDSPGIASAWSLSWRKPR